MNNTIIFLGAGASKADGAPLQNELFKSYVCASKKQPQNTNFNNRHFKIKRNVCEFFDSFFGLEILDNNVSDFPTFEEVLGVLDLAIGKGEEYKKEINKLTHYRSSIIFSMAEAIQYELDLKEKDNNYAIKYHHNLVNNLINHINNREVSFISTNYDLLIDNSLIYAGLIPNYGFIDNGKDVDLLKIHGSLNWLYCPVCKTISSTVGQKVMINAVLDPNITKCEVCQSNQRYVIIPPTYFKDMSNHYLSRIWSYAEKLLCDAEHIIFCGYSFPDADMHIKYLLKRAELNRNINKRLKVTIINYFSGKNEKDSDEEKKRYLRFFKKSTTINYLNNISFEQFAQNPIQIIKL